MHNPKLSILIVVKDDQKGLAATLNSLHNLYSHARALSLPLLIQIIVKDGSKAPLLSSSRLQGKFSILKIQYIHGNDNGIYDAMTCAFNISCGDYVTFLNAGDTVIPENYLRAYCSLYTVMPQTILYGYTDWYNKSSPGLPLWIDKFVGIQPYLGRLPNHQAMLIPRDIQNQLGFNSSFSVSADKDFKIRAAKFFSYFNLDYSIVTSRPGGRSQSIRNINHLCCRTNELFRLMNSNFGLIQAVAYSILFFIWNSRKLISLL